MRKSVVSVLMAVVMMGCFAGCAVPDNSANTEKDETSSQKLDILKSDMKLTQDQTASKIKAEYLKKNDGYKKSDEVVAIVTLPDDALIDTYLSGDTAEESVGDYAAGSAGAAQASRIAAKQNSLIAELLRAELISGVENRYSAILNGVAVNTTYGNLGEIEKLKSVDSVILSDTFNRPQAMSGTDVSGIVNNVDVYDTGIFNSGSVPFTGKGTAVAVLDSGFDCSHSVFAKQPEGDLWLTQQHISATLAQTNAAKTTRGLELTDVWYSRKIPYVYDYADKDNDVFPYDSEHGTHVAGIIGGSDDVITGVAVDTQLVLMKVFPDLDDGAKTDDILAALEDAVLLGVDAINMSLGSSCGFAREEDGNKINDVYDKLNESGISLLTAASNSYSSAFGGEQGNTNKVTNPDSSTVGSPSTYQAALSVASISGVKSRYLVANGEQIVFFHESSSITGKENDFVGDLYKSQNIDQSTEKTFEYVTVPGYGTRANYQEIDVKGKIALVRRGENTFEDKALRAKNAGAIACIIYNNVEGDISMSMGKTDHIPTISIAKDLGTKLAERSSGTLTVSLSNQAGPFMSDFSSWGPSPNLELKPEITAHGGTIKSSIPGGGYDELSGTSMATPNLCGIVVLIRQFLKEKFPDYTQKEIVVLANQLLMSTATIVVNEEGNPYSPRKQGAGLASLYNVVNTKAYISVDGIDRTKLELKDDPKRNGVYTMKFNVVNLSNEAVKYNLSLVGMTETVSTSDDEFVAERGQLLGGKYSAKLEGKGSLKNNVVTVNAGETVKLTVTYTLSGADKKLIDSLFPNGMFVEGFVKLTAQNDGIDLNVPFLAFYGDWTRAPIFDKTYYEVDPEEHDNAIDEEDKLKADYFATTPYGSYFYNYIIPLGTYLYDIDPDYDYIPASEDHIALSGDTATIDGISAIYGGLLRNAKTMTYTITDKLTGEVKKEFIDYNANKAYSLGGTPIPYFEYLNWRTQDLNLTNNRNYEFKMTAALDYGDGGATTNLRNTFSFDFCFDNEAPVLKSAVYEKVYDRTLKKDRYYLTMTVYDNHYAMSITPLIFTSDKSYATLTENPIPIYSEKGKDNVIRIEITDYLEDVGHDVLITSALGFSIDDYALNSNIWLCQLPGTKGDFRFTRNGEYDGSELNILTVNEGEIIDLTAYLATSDKTVDADKDYLKYLDWTSSNEKVAVVKEGQVRGLSAGRSTITVTERMELRQATILINVRAKASATAQSETEERAEKRMQTLSNNHVPDVSDDSVAIESLRFSYFETTFAYSRAAQTSDIGKTGSKIFLAGLGSRVSMYPGERIKIFYDLKPWYVSEKYRLAFTSSDPTIARVDRDTGDLTALRKGSVTIYLRVYDKNADFDGEAEPTPVSSLMARLSVTVNSEFVIENRTLVAYKGYGDENGTVVIPDDEGILYIGAFAFCLYDVDNTIPVPDEDLDANKVPSTNTSIKRVIVPEGVEDIQKYAFYNCPGLESVQLPSTVKYIREYAFCKDEKLASINLDNVMVIGQRAFQGCGLLDGVALNKTYAIGAYAFQDCTSLSAVNLGSLRNTGTGAFHGCTSLASAELNENTKLSDRMFARTGLKRIELFERLLIPEFCFAQCKELESVEFRNDVVTIANGAFCENDKLKSVKFRGVSAIGDQAFYDCHALEILELPDSEFSLGNYVFRDCERLSAVVLDKNTKFKEATGIVFQGTSLTEFRFAAGIQNENYSVSADGRLLLNKAGDTVVFAAAGYDFGNFVLDGKYVKIASGAFSGVSINSVTITNSDTEIGDYAFARCESLVSVILPSEGVKSIGMHAFRYASALSEVRNLDRTVSIGDYAFANTAALGTVAIGANAEVGEGAFFSSGLKTVAIGANAKFGMGAFQNCYQLVAVNMPAGGGVHFGASCFANDASLVTIDMSKHDAIVESETFYGCSSLRGLQNRINLAEATEVGRYAFADCSSLSAVVMPKVVSIGEGAFARYDEKGGAPVIQSIVLPDTLKTIGDGAFLGCEYLEEITIPDSLETMGDFVFAYCLRLERVKLPQTLKTIGDYAFASCESLVQINLGNVEEIGDYAFISSTALEQIDLASAKAVGFGSFADTWVTGDITANELLSIGDYAFQNTDILSFRADRLKEIGEAAFLNNRRLAEFVFSKDLEKIAIRAFNGCKGLTSFYFEDGGEKKGEGSLNEYAKLQGGALYTKLATDGWELASVPAGMAGETLEIAEGTRVIGFYAGNANTNVKKIVLPDSLRTIGNYAFYGYSGLESVEFKSVTAPALEGHYDKDAKLNENDPGYGLLHDQFGMFGLELCYFNFIDLVGKKNPIKMILPSNKEIKGYDSLVFQAYFGKVEDADRSDYVAMQEALVNFLDYAKKIAKIEKISLSDEKLVNDAIAALNGVSQSATSYGYTEEEWNALVKAVNDAKSAIDAMKNVPVGPVTDEQSEMPVWAIALISVAAAVVAVGMIVSILLIGKKKGGKQ